MFSLRNILLREINAMRLQRPLTMVTTTGAPYVSYPVNPPPLEKLSPIKFMLATAATNAVSHMFPCLPVKKLPLLLCVHSRRAIC